MKSKLIIVGLLLIALIGGLFLVRYRLSKSHITNNDQNLGEEEVCLARGDVWRQEGILHHYRCVHFYPDGGKPCSSSSECEGRCVVHRQDGSNAQCEKNDSPVGCSGVIEDCELINGEHKCPILCAD